MNTVLACLGTSPVNMKDRKDLGIKVGDTVRVHQKIQDKDKTRIQVFEGLVLARKHGDEAGATFTVRKVASGVGVEKIFPLYSPVIDKIEIVRRAKVRRSKLYYLREKSAKEIRKKMRGLASFLPVSYQEEEADVALTQQFEGEATATHETPEQRKIDGGNSPKVQKE